MDHVDEQRVGRIQSDERGHALEQGLSRIQAGYPAQARNALPGVSGNVSPQRVADKVNVLGLNVEVVLKSLKYIYYLAKFFFFVLAKNYTLQKSHPEGH